MKRLSVLAVLVVLAIALGAAPVAAAGATTTVERFVFSYDHVDPPHHGCITESVHYTGEYEVTIITVRNAAGGVTRSLHYRQRIYGVGLTTGNTYAILAQYSEVNRSSGTSGSFTSTFPLSYVEISAGGAQNYLSRTLLHVTVNAQGEPTVTIEEGSIRCVG